MERHDRLSADPAYRAAHIELKNLSKYAADFTEIYNKAWAGHGGMKQLRLEQVKHMFRQMKAVYGTEADLVCLSSGKAHCHVCEYS